MSKFFYNIADNNACFLINCKILVTRETKIKIIHLPLERKVILHKITNDNTTELHGQVRQFQKNKTEVITKNFKEM